MTASEQLTRLQMEILEFERATWARGAGGRREHLILTRFGHTTTRHAQIVNHLIDHPAATRYDAQLVRQLRARRDQAAGAHRRRGFEVAR